MHNRAVTQQFGRGAAWRVRLSSLCPSEAACKATRHPLPARAPHFVVQAYVLQRNAGTLTNLKGVAHELKDINLPSVNIVHIKRESPCDNSELSDIVQELSSFKTKVRCTHASAAEASDKLLSYLPSGPATRVLSLDIQNLVYKFLHVSGSEAVDATLSVITATSCPRFHADHVELRCLCTYSGEGTYFVPNAAVDRRKWMRALGIQDTDGFGVKSARHIQQATEWDVVILKGNAFPGNEGAGAVHKSPSASEESPRLLLTLDKALPRVHSCPDC